MKFDDNFVKMVNSYDLMILGGGGFFDLKWDDSNTGTTIDFSKQLIDSIKIPVLINGMGYHEYDSISDENVKKFKEFLKNVIGKGGWLVSVRNDGSYSRLKNRYGDIVKDILTVPDHGFYYSPKNYSQFNLENKNKIWIGLNITNELFSKVFNKEIDTIFFNNQIGQFINNTLENDLKKNIIFFPHAYQDIVTIAKITCEIKDKYIRERIAIAPLFSGKVQIEEIFDLYRICKCVIAMRFHGNVCPIGMNIPTIGLAGHEQIYGLYKELDIIDRCVIVNHRDFVTELSSVLDRTLKDSNLVHNLYYDINILLNKKTDTYMDKIHKFIKRNTHE